MTKAKAFPSLDLDEVKDDVGMPVAGTENDAWLDRRISGILARFQKYTNRYLGPVISFQDKWQPTRPEHNAPAYWPSRAGVAFYTRNYPVESITAATEHGAPIDPATIIFEGASGSLIGYGEPTAPSRFVLPVVTYSAGFQEMPADLYEAMIGILRSLWASRSMDKSGLSVGGMTPSALTIADVGDVSLTQGGGQGFDAALTAGGEYADPYLGPYTYMLDSYTDLRASMGSALMPVTTVVDAPPGPSTVTTSEWFMPPPDNFIEMVVGVEDASWITLGMYLEISGMGTLRVTHKSNDVLGLANPGIPGNAAEGTESLPGATVKQAGS